MYWHGKGEEEVDNDNEGEDGVAEYGDDERVAAVLSYACRESDDGVGRGVEKMWRKRFFDRSLIVPVPHPH